MICSGYDTILEALVQGVTQLGHSDPFFVKDQLLDGGQTIVGIYGASSITGSVFALSSMLVRSLLSRIAVSSASNV